MMRKICALIRDPDESRSHIEYLLHLSSDLSMEVELLYIQNPLDYPLGTPGLTGTASAHLHAGLAERAEKGKKKIKQLLDQARKNTGIDTLVSIESEVGVTGSVIDEHIEDPKSTLLTLQSNEHKSVWSQDPTNIDIIRNTTCPVMIIPKNEKYQPFDEIEYATDYNAEDFDTLQNLIQLMKPFEPRITAIHITGNVEFDERIRQAGFIEMVKEKTGYEKVAIKSLSEKDGDDLPGLISNYGSLINANLIVVLKENHHFLDRIFKSSTTKKIVEQAKTPVLVYHE